jgi:hypothetical protein
MCWQLRRAYYLDFARAMAHRGVPSGYVQRTGCSACGLGYPHQVWWAPPMYIARAWALERIQLGWVVRWVLSTPPRATPRLGGVYVPCQCQYLPCSFVLALCATSAFDWGSKPHSRSAPAPVGSSPGLVLLPVTALSKPAVTRSLPFRAIWLRTRDRDYRYCLAALRRGGKASPVADGRMAHGLVSDVLENGSHRCVPLACFTASEITNHPVSFTTTTLSPPPVERRRTTEMGVFQTPGHGL